jgi:anti-sigma factor RsiW
MSGHSEISEGDLHAFIDGELDAVRRQAVEAVLRADPALAERAYAYRADKDTLKRAFAGSGEQRIPPQWLALTQAAKTTQPTSWRLVGTIAAAVVAGVIGTLTFQQLQPRGTGEIVQAALDARATNAGENVAIGNAEAHQYDGRLSATVAVPVKIPDMRKLGYQLVGMRLYPRSSGSGAAELLYRGRNNELLTLYLRRSDGKVRADQWQQNGLRICVWQDDVLGMVVAGNMSTAAMQRLASLAYTGLTS